MVEFLISERKCLLKPLPSSKETEVSVQDLQNIQLYLFLCSPRVLSASWPRILFCLLTLSRSVAAELPYAYNREKSIQGALQLRLLCPIRMSISILPSCFSMINLMHYNLYALKLSMRSHTFMYSVLCQTGRILKPLMIWLKEMLKRLWTTEGYLFL